MKCLFVCLGNICRSPTAEGVFKAKLIQKNLDKQISCDSAGTSAWHIGDPPDPRSIEHALQRGYDLRSLRARQVTEADFAEFDWIFAMDDENYRNLKTIKNRYLGKSSMLGHDRQDNDDKVANLARFLDFPNKLFAHSEVPDPYHKGEEGFEEVLDLIEAASDYWIAQLAQR